MDVTDISTTRVDRKSLGEPIARGKHGRIFAWSEGRVLKLFRPGADVELVRREFAVTHFMRGAGVPTWRIDEIVSVESRNGARIGLVGERIAGRTFAAAIREGRLGLPEAVRRLIRMHERIDAVDAPPDIFRKDWTHASYKWPIIYDPRAFTRVGVCHGDLSLDNLMLRDDGETAVVDWGHAHHGPVIADVVRASRSLNTALKAPGVPLVSRLMRAPAVRAHQIVMCRKMGWPMLWL